VSTTQGAPVAAAAAAAGGGAARPGGRLAWVDLVKGVAICLVVLHHATQELEQVAAVPSVLLRLDEQLASFRMPLFFLASGLFAARTLTSAWDVVWRRRVLFFAWVYVLWSVVQHVAVRALPSATPGDDPTRLLDLLVGLVHPSTVLWFLYALAVFSIVVRAAHRVPPGLHLLLAAVVAVLVGGRVIPVEDYAWRSMGAYYVFFVAGVQHRALVDRFAARTTWPRALAAAALYAACAYAVGELVPDKPPGVRLALSAAALVAGASLAVVMAPTRPGALLAWLGQRTLPVYVAHFPVVVALVAPLVVTGHRPGAAPAVGLLALVVVVAVAVPLLLQRAAVRAGAGWLYRPPTRLTAPAPAPAGRAADGP
jgi:uncharacterized membrane protein YcfT